LLSGAAVRTTDRPYARWLEFVAHVLSQPTVALTHDLVADEIRKTFECTAVAFFSWPNGSGTPVLKIWPDSFRSIAPPGSPDIYALNPLQNYYRITNDPSARGTTEVPSRIADRRALAAWREFSDPLQLYHQLALPLSPIAPSQRAYVLGRSSGVFTREELELARVLQPVLAAVDRQAVVLRHLPSRRPTAGNDPLLTGRELAVLTLLAQGLTAASIGRRLGITARTVNKHLERAYPKLRVNNRVAAVVAAQRIGILPNPEA
jgi:DNA-binding CsgD family transcriptional regulator